MKRIPSLDGIRAIAVSLVILRHAGYGFANMGMFGVQIFFVLSGFLITKLLLAEYAENGVIDLLAFYRRRCFRILPAAFAYMLVVAALVPLARPDLPMTLSYLGSYHLNWSSNALAHLWSLSVEEQFYLLWPVALVLAFSRRFAVAVATIALTAAFRMSVVILHPWHFYQMLHNVFPAVMDSLAVGCLLAICEPQVASLYRKVERFSGLLMIALPLFAASAVSLLWGIPITHATAGVVAVGLWGIVPALLACWIFIATQHTYWLLNNPVAVGMGALSYSLYLWQQPFAQPGAPIWNLIPIFACAAISYFVVEQPMIALGKTSLTFVRSEVPVR